MESDLMVRQSLKSLIREPRTLTDALDRFDPEYPNADRSIAILQCAVLEEALETAIISRFVPLSKNDIALLFEGDNPLATFSAKIKIGYAVGLYGAQTRADLTCIRDIRNVFAHAAVEVDFETQEIAAACAQLRAKLARTGKEATAQWRYISATNQLGRSLLEIANDCKPVKFSRALP